MFASKNRDFVRCGLQTMTPLFSKITGENGRPISLSRSMTDEVIKKPSDRGIVKELFYNFVCLVWFDSFSSLISNGSKLASDCVNLKKSWPAN